MSKTNKQPKKQPAKESVLKGANTGRQVITINIAPQGLGAQLIRDLDRSTRV